MKKTISLLVAFLLVFTLAACGDNNQVPDDILDCIANPDDPDCDIPDEVDCLLNPDDPSCQVDCNATPDDPACQVDCTVNPTDPACQVDCSVTPDDPACQVDCSVTPDDPSCPIVCEDGYQEVLGQCVLIDNRTPEEILVDAILANWDGSMDHVDAAMLLLDTDDASEVTIEFNLEVVDSENVTHVVNVTSHDTYVYGPYSMMRREITVDFDGEMIEVDMILEEKENGVNVYYNTEFLRGIMLTTENDPDGDIQGVLDALDANGTWFMFRFDDSLANLVEIEVLKEMLIELFYEQYGVNFFYELQDELEQDIQVDLEALYGINFGLFMDYVLAEDWVNAQAQIDMIDFEGLVLELDQAYLVPEIHILMDQYTPDILLLDPTFDMPAHHTALDTLGTLDYLDSLTESEVLIFAEVLVDSEFAGLIDAYYADEVEEYIVDMVVADPNFNFELAQIPGFDEIAFIAALDGMDFDALYMEMPNLSMLPMAIYEGQASFDTFVSDLALTSPLTASLLSPLSGTIYELEEYMVIVDDISYGLENLTMFAEYFDIAYYIENDMLLFDLDANDDLELETSITLDSSESTTLFTDLMSDIYDYLDGFQSFEMPYIEGVNCPAGETDCMPFAQYAEIIGVLGTLGDTVITTTYDPINTTDMEYRIDFTGFLNSVIQLDDMNDSSIADASITVTVSESDGFDLPAETEVTDLNNVANEFAKFSLVMKAYDYLEDYVETNDLTGVENDEMVPINMTEVPINYSMAFDPNMSMIIINHEEVLGVPVINVEIDLYWLDGTNVFDAPVGYDELALVFGAAASGAPDHAIYTGLIDLIDEDNYNTTKLLLMYLWEQDNEPSPIVIEY